ncbi:MAG TPA: ribonuclease PH [Planctomycetaceae bacterium]|nr:ribonuclease PH [Planctomycetaceae bacterium]
MMSDAVSSFRRRDGRSPDELRPISIQRNYTSMTAGSVLIGAGRTVVLCTASIDESLPPWMKGQTRGWVTAEYNMLPGSTSPRKPRDRGGKIDGRTTEIQRLVGRSLRAVVNLEALGPRTITVDCDVLQADGGTRTLSITGGYIALVDAVASLAGQPGLGQSVFRTSVAAVSLGLVDDRLLLDLDYSEDSRAQVDCNFVMTGSGEFVEIQATAEGRTFTQAQFDAQLQMARAGAGRITALQQQALGADWPF